MKSKLVMVWLILATIVTGCASVEKTSRQSQVASVMAYLFPNSGKVPPPSTQVAELKVPFRIGVAFVPDNSNPEFRLPEKERISLATQVREAFSGYPFVSELVAIPSSYLGPGGGFENLGQVASLFKLDVVALISFDQVQNAGATGWSFLYWTGLGAYVIDGDQFDILTAVETSVFDVNSRQLLLRAGGLSSIKGTATMVGFSEQARLARTQSFEKAIQDMISNLHSEVKQFRQSAAKNPNVRLILPPGYNSNATREVVK